MKFKLKIFENFDFILFFSVIVLVTIGICFIYSSGIDSSGVNVSNEFIKQIVFASSGIILMLVAMFIDYRKLQKYIFWIFVGLCGILIYTRFWGREVNGAKSWLGIGDFGIQPSEFGKIIFIMYLASFLEKTDKQDELKRYAKALVILLCPVGLILLQPDLGTALVYIPVFLVMCYIANVPKRYILMIFSIGMVTILFTVLPIWEETIAKRDVALLNVLTNMKLRLIIILATSMITIISIVGYILTKRRYYYWISYVFIIVVISLFASVAAGKVLADYQVKRLIIFLDPQSDPLGAGWNIIQSKVAIGSGNLFGQGFLQGTQSHYRFLPEQSTDFIFSILSEEWGFAGGVVVFGLYFIILFRCILIMRNTTNTYGYYITTGIFTMFLFHFLINVGMVMGIMPITGIPLCFLSYGGSSLWTAMTCVGLLLSINARKLDF